MSDRTAPPGHSKAAHHVFGWCSACPGRELWEELTAWRARENDLTPALVDGDDGHALVLPVVGDLVEEWCPHCKAQTLATAQITAVVPDGVARIGGLAICRECAWSPNGEAGRG